MVSKQTFLREVKFILGCGAASVAQAYFMCTRCQTDVYSFGYASLFCFCMWVFLWRGNSYITCLIDEKISWVEDTVKRFVVGILSTIGFSVTVVVLGMFFFQRVFHFSFGDSFVPTIIYSIITTIIVSLFLQGREFLLSWRKSELNAVKLRNENLSSRYESLKSQLDPHFLFNSLNVLTNLVYQDPDQSARFIKQLSEVYRYVLEVREKEVVPLAEELKFVEAYLFLQKIRFGDKLIVENNLLGKDGLVPPLALQLLVENAIKHNVISEENPLTIKLSQEDAYLIVENNLQKKNELPDETSGIGLANIRKRYEFLMSKAILVEEEQQRFRVKLPCIESIES